MTGIGCWLGAGRVGVRLDKRSRPVPRANGKRASQSTTTQMGSEMTSQQEILPDQSGADVSDWGELPTQQWLGGTHQGVRSRSLLDHFEYSADEYRESAGYPPLPDALVPLAYAAKHRLEDRSWFTRSFRRGLKGLFR